MKRYEGEPIGYDRTGCLVIVVAGVASIWTIVKIVARVRGVFQ